MKLVILFFFFGITAGFSQVPELIFHSGFEPDVKDTTDGVSADIFGVDNSVSPPNNWIFDLEGHPNIGNFSIQYQGGNDTMRFAEIAQDPSNVNNNVLHYWLKYPNVGGTKGRVQANIYGNTNLTEIYQKVRLYLPADWNIIKNVNATVEWLTIMEFWNNLPLQDPVNPFRITLGIHKKNASSQKLTFNLKAQIMPDPPPWPIVWEESDTSFSVPIEQWMTLEFYFKEGDGTNGRFVFAVTPDGGTKNVIFDVTDFTHHPNDASPDGLVRFNPMKLYTSDALINYVRNSGGVLQVFWDDFELWKDIDLITSVTVQTHYNKGVKIYPNPMKETTLIEFDNEKREIFNLVLFDVQGRVVREISGISTNQIVITKGNLRGGLYFYRLYANDNRSITGKLVIE